MLWSFLATDIFGVQASFAGHLSIWKCLIVPSGLDSGELFLARIVPDCIIHWGHMISVCLINGDDKFDHQVKVALARFLHCKGNFSSLELIKNM